MYWLNGMYETSLAPPISPVNKENGIDQPSNLGAVPHFHTNPSGGISGRCEYIYIYLILYNIHIYAKFVVWMLILGNTFGQQ